MIKNLLAVTGTNGKTSVVSYVHQILSIIGKSNATIGTLGIRSSKKLPQKLISIKPKMCTTPDYNSFNKILDGFSSLSIDNVIFEASSHGLHQGRLGNIKVKAAGFTSFSQDHLGYHKTMKNYLNTKLFLFTNHLIKDGLVVINSDTLYFNFIEKFLCSHKIRYKTVGRKGELKIIKCSKDIKGINVRFIYNQKEYIFNTNIVGSFQAINILIAACLIQEIGINFDKVIETFDKLIPPPGRLERVTNLLHNYHVFVDYAHNPEALKKSLQELKFLKKNGRLIVIFGCGGGSHKSQRYYMGKIAANIADKVIITDDNPRDEDAKKIREEILLGAVGANEISDRREAIKTAISDLKKDDILLVAGKGHEDYQIIGNKSFYFSDLKVVKEYL